MPSKSSHRAPSRADDQREQQQRPEPADRQMTRRKRGSESWATGRDSDRIMAVTYPLPGRATSLA